MTETTIRILSQMKKYEQNAHQVEIGANLPNASIQSWVKGKKRKDGSIVETSPSAEAITKLARYFNVSADYLLCLTNEPKPLTKREVAQISSSVPVILEEMPDLFKEQRFVNTAKIYNELPDEYRERAFGLIMGIAVGLGINVEQILRK